MKKPFCVLFILFFCFTFVSPACSRVIYLPRTAPIAQGPLYDEQGNGYYYTGACLAGGAGLPVGHSLYDKEGNVYYTDQCQDRTYLQSNQMWWTLGVLNSVVANNSTQYKTEKELQLYAQQQAIIREDVKTMAENEIQNVVTVVNRRGIAALIDDLDRFCSLKRYPHSSFLLNGNGCFRYTNNTRIENQLMEKISYEYLFDTNTNECSVSITVPNAEITETANSNYNEKPSKNLKGFGLTINQQQYVSLGYAGYSIKRVNPWSRADRSGFKEYDHIIKVGYHSIDSGDTVMDLVKQASDTLNRQKYPLTVSVLRHGTIKQLIVYP